jgi:hypothetical protein
MDGPVGGAIGIGGLVLGLVALTGRLNVGGLGATNAL